METISIFFLLSSFIVIIYIIYIFRTTKRLPILIEIFYLIFYISIFIIFLYPNILNLFERLFNIKSAINFFIYLSIFVIYFLNLQLYKKIETQRVEITTIVREIAYLKRKIETLKQKSKK